MRKVIFGAFDLYPPKRQMCMPGKVYIRYLTPIQPSEASTRDEMSRLIRRRMLDAWRECPSDICRQLNFMQRYSSNAHTHIFLLNFLYLTI